MVIIRTERGMNMEKIVSVAQYIYNEYKNISGEDIDEMKLHKLLYLSQRESLAITGAPLFNEDFQGWMYGPVNLEVRKRFKNGTISKNVEKEISLEAAYIAKNIILQYGAYEPWKLSELSHNETSWKKSREGIPNGVKGSNIINIDDIREDAKKVRPYDSVWDMYYDEFEDYENMEG